jgi:hypothetical protein
MKNTLNHTYKKKKNHISKHNGQKKENVATKYLFSPPSLNALQKNLDKKVQGNFKIK